MKFVTEGVEQAVQAVYSSISSKLSDGKTVLWLVSGGSAVTSQVQIMQQLQAAVPQALANLTVLPVDERYGVKSHENSNTFQMQTAGFSPGAAHWPDILDGNLPLSETVSHYNTVASDALAAAEYVLATLGMGADGHTAGVLPGSPAITDTTSTVVGYSWSDYERMTLGVPALLQIDTAYVLAYGESKKSALERLYENDEPVELLPAKILYDLPVVTVYNDYIESEG